MDESKIRKAFNSVVRPPKRRESIQSRFQNKRRSVALPESQDPLEAFLEDLTGVKSGLQALGFTGVEEELLHELWQVRRMVETGDPIQARMPFTLHVK